MTEPTHLSREQLAPIVAAIHQRETYARAGAGFLLPPFADCPTCGQAPTELLVSNDHPDFFLADRVGIGFRPCGHNFTADGNDVDRAYDLARQQEGP